MFAKLYEKDGRQILVRKDLDNDGAPAICFETEAELGHIACYLSFSDDEAGDAARDSAFEKVDAGMAENVIGGLFQKLELA